MKRRSPAGVAHQPAARGRLLREMPPVTKQGGEQGKHSTIVTSQGAVRSFIVVNALVAGPT